MIRHLLLSLLSFGLLLAVFSAQAQDTPPQPITLSWTNNLLSIHHPEIPGETIEIGHRSVYRELTLEGWTCLLHPDLEDKPELWKAVRAELVRQMRAIKAVVPAKAVRDLQRQHIWIEYKHPRHPCMCYHVDPDWLRKNHMNPEKAGHVELANANNFLDWCRRSQPWMLLHEFAHGYHDGILDFENAEINKAYKRALADNLYGRVKDINGRLRLHYGATNDREFFAEATEAYFGKNDFPPFTREEFRQYDPETFTLIERLWGVKKSE